MRTALKATMIGLMAIVMGLFIAPEAKSGSSCCSSTSAVSPAEASSSTSEINQDVIRLEELSGRLARNISELEDRLSGMIDGIEEDQLRMELEGVERVVATLRSDIVDYQILSLKVLTDAEQTDGRKIENSVPATITQNGCNH